MQTGKPEKEVAGNAVITLDGLLQGKPLSLTFAQASPSHRVSLAYSLKYFQEYNEPIELPPGFEPTRVGVEIRSGRDANHSFQAGLRVESTGNVGGNRG